MSTNITARASRALNAQAEATNRVTRALLWAGVVAGPLFILVAFVQVITRPGFDLSRDAISLLTLGDLGWIQRANFVICGLLVVTCAIGIRRALGHRRGGTWGALLFGCYGVGLVIAGLFTPDPSFGFPRGLPPGWPPA